MLVSAEYPANTLRMNPANGDTGYPATPVRAGVRLCVLSGICSVHRFDSPSEAKRDTPLLPTVLSENHPCFDHLDIDRCGESHPIAHPLDHRSSDSVNIGHTIIHEGGILLQAVVGPRLIVRVRDREHVL